MSITPIYRLRHNESIRETDKQRNILLSIEDARQLNQSISNRIGLNYERLFFGQKITDALAHGLEITRTGYFEATESPAALQTGATLLLLYKKLRSQKKMKVLDFFAGTGQMSWAFDYKIEQREVLICQTFGAANSTGAL